MLQDMEKKGELTRDVTPSRLLRFLDEVTEVVLQADFKGLVILPDELQQYISKSKTHRMVIEELRQFVWGLLSRKTALGVLFSLPDYAESAIREAGDDILQRLRNENLYYNLGSIYGREFPTQLWERYCQTLDLGEAGRRIFDVGTLDAIGQIASRPDLGNGPRTVINLFRVAIEHYRDRGESFTPEYLIDTYLRGSVKFEGQTPQVRVAVNEALGAPLVNTDARRRAIKYLAAFPHTGCSDEIQRKYGIQDAIIEISKAGGHGTLLSYRMVGDTLRELLQTEQETNVFAQIAREFWRIYDEDDQHAEAAERAFVNEIVPRIFPSKKGPVISSWSGHKGLEMSPSGCHRAILEGTFSDKYPKRKLQIQIAIDEGRLGRKDPQSDVAFDFYLNWDVGAEAQGRLLKIEKDHIRFDLVMLQRPEGSLPSDIKQLQEYMNPSRVTPLLMLSLVDYIDRWVQDKDVEPTVEEKGLLNHIKERLINHTILQLFNAAPTNTFEGMDFRGPLLTGTRLVDRMFTGLCEQLWPNYATFFVQATYTQIIDDYIASSCRLRLGSQRKRGSQYRRISTLFRIGKILTPVRQASLRA